MLGIGNIIGSITDTLVEEVDDFIDQPINYVVDKALQPVRDGVEVLEGLTEGEIRTAAAARLGADFVAGMAFGEVVDALIESLD